MEQNREPKINPCIYCQLIYDEGGKNIQYEKDSLFNKWCWENWTATYERTKTDHYFTSYTKLTQNELKTSNVKTETL